MHTFVHISVSVLVSELIRNFGLPKRGWQVILRHPARKHHKLRTFGDKGEAAEGGVLL